MNDPCSKSNVYVLSGTIDHFTARVEAKDRLYFMTHFWQDQHLLSTSQVTYK